MMKFFDLQPW